MIHLSYLNLVLKKRTTIINKVAYLKEGYVNLLPLSRLSFLICVLAPSFAKPLAHPAKDSRRQTLAPSALDTRASHGPLPSL